MTKIKNGGPAFPVMWDFAENETGMSLRDWFAGQIISARVINQGSHRHKTEQEYHNCRAANARAAYALADAMLAAREAEP